MVDTHSNYTQKQLYTKTYLVTNLVTPSSNENIKLRLAIEIKLLSARTNRLIDRETLSDTYIHV